jgi:hypothetical protein
MPAKPGLASSTRVRSPRRHSSPKCSPTHKIPELRDSSSRTYPARVSPWKCSCPAKSDTAPDRDRISTAERPLLQFALCARTEPDMPLNCGTPPELVVHSVPHTYAPTNGTRVVPADAPTPQQRRASTPALPRRSCQNRRRGTWIGVIRNGRAANRTNEMASGSADQTATRQGAPVLLQVMSRVTPGRMKRCGQNLQEGTEMQVGSRPWTSCRHCPHPLGRTTGHITAAPTPQKAANDTKSLREIPTQVMSSERHRDMNR